MGHLRSVQVYSLVQACIALCWWIRWLGGINIHGVPSQSPIQTLVRPRPYLLWQATVSLSPRPCLGTCNGQLPHHRIQCNMMQYLWNGVIGVYECPLPMLLFLVLEKPFKPHLLTQQVKEMCCLQSSWSGSQSIPTFSQARVTFESNVQKCAVLIQWCI